MKTPKEIVDKFKEAKLPAHVLKGLITGERVATHHPRNREWFIYYTPRGDSVNPVKVIVPDVD
jgi:hypothetical protein